MSATTLLLVSFAIAAHTAPTFNIEPCACDSDSNSKEKDALFNFLNDIEKDTVEFPPVPGLLSPNVPCSNCLEYNRKKRKILIDTNIKFPQPLEFVTEKDGDLPVGVPRTVLKAETSRVQAEERCPGGLVKVGRWCVDDDDY